MLQKFICFFCFLIASMVTTPSFAQYDGWDLQNCGKELILSDIYFINADTGWVVGYGGFGGYGLIMNTSDGGENWITQDSSDTEYMSVQFTDSEHGWAAGYRDNDNHGALFHSNNGGQSWYLKDSFRYELSDLCFINADTGYAVGGGRGQTMVLRTTDAGESWDSLDAWGGHMHTVFFINGKVGWVAGERGAVSKTEDGGDSWSTSYVDVGFGNITSIHFTDQDTGWMVGSDQIFKTADGGESWEPQVESDNTYFRSCYFINSNLGWISAYNNYSLGEIRHTSDGGENWQVQTFPGDIGNLNSFFFIDDTTGWCIAYYGNILKTTAGGVVSVYDMENTRNGGPEQFRLNQNFPNPFNSITTIAYNLPASGHVSLVVYNMQGEEVRILINGKQSAGKYSLTFDGSGLPSGIYYYKLTDTGEISVKEMLLLK